MRSLITIFIAAAIPLASCTTSPDAYYESQPRCRKSQPDADLTERCFAVPQAHEYLENAKQRVLDTWRLPRGIASDQKVTLTFRLRSDGSVQCLLLAPGSEKRLSRSVLSALQRVTPFAPPPPEAVCLTELPIIATFSNPAAKR